MAVGLEEFSAALSGCCTLQTWLVWSYQIKFLFTKGLNMPLLEAVHVRVRGVGWQKWRVAHYSKIVGPR
jgi:hypothetical protein